MIKDKMYRFNAKEIEVKDWIKDQLQTQLNGLSGNLHKFWPDIKESAWIGGDKDSWERVPYWLDGYIPLVYLLNDEEGIKVANRYVKSILKRQQADGWIAPGKVEDREKYDVWGIFIILKALLGYAEINKSSKTYKVIRDSLYALDKHIDKYPLFEWAKFRWYECLIPIYACYQKFHEEWLIDLTHKLHNQGFDYYNHYKNNFLKKKETVGNWTQEAHIVNNCMAVKAYTLYAKISGNKEDKRKAKYMLKTLNKYHGAVTGAINGDECFAGKDPRQGSEFCSINELMYSLELIEQITGDSFYQTQLERLAFNALPSVTTNDMWAHQYVNQVNAPFIKKSDVHLWTTNGPETNLYGLEPNFGCCTANMHQGWPKFVNSAICYKGRTLFVNSYIPVDIHNKNYDIEVNSAYPFNYKVEIKVNALNDGTIKLLIPSWTSYALINNEKIVKKGYVNFSLNKGENKFEILFITKPNWEKRGGKFALVNGPLVYALKVEQEKVRINADDPMKEEPHGDYEFNNLSPFAYQIHDFEIKEERVEKIDKLSPFVREKPVTTYLINTDELSYKVKGNYAIIGSSVIKENVLKEFIPIGINKLHMGELKKR